VVLTLPSRRCRFSDRHEQRATAASGTLKGFEARPAAGAGAFVAGLANRWPQPLHTKVALKTVSPHSQVFLGGRLAGSAAPGMATQSGASPSSRTSMSTKTG